MVVKGMKTGQKVSKSVDNFGVVVIGLLKSGLNEAFCRENTSVGELC